MAIKMERKPTIKMERQPSMDIKMERRQSESERATSVVDVDMYTQLIKAHLNEEPSHCTKLWQSSDLDLVVSHHSQFLVGIANLGGRISCPVLTSCLHKHFKSNRQECGDFAKKIADCLSYCRKNTYSVRDGSKTHKAVLEVTNALNPSLCNNTKQEPSPSTPAVKQEKEEPTTPQDGSLRNSLMRAFDDVVTGGKPAVADSPFSVASSASGLEPGPLKVAIIYLYQLHRDG